MATVDKEQLDIATKLAALIDRMAVASSKIENAQATQVESMKQLAVAMNTLNVRETVEQLNDVGTNVKLIIDKMNELSKTQQQTFEQMGKKVSETGGSVTTLTQKMRDTQSAVNDVNKAPLDGLLRALETPGGMAKLLFDKVKKVGDYLSKRFPIAWTTAAAAATGFYQGLQNVMSIGRGVLGFLGGMVDTLTNVAGSILSIPFKMFTGLIDIANNAAGGSNELAQAIENIRKEFGALNQNGPQTIKELATNLTGFADTGLSAYRIFGNMAQRLEQFLKLAQVMGPLFEELSDEFKKNGGAILAWQKGLGLADEQMQEIGRRSKTFGKTMTDDLMDIQKLSQGMGKDFGISGKIISRSMVKSASDVKHFANVSNKAIGEAVVYAHKLGVELEKITGVLDAFDTFDSAAENASKLSQAFGLNVDAMKMMESATPADAIDQLRKSFAAAGKDAATMDRYQLKLLASSTGLDEKTAQTVFSLKNQGKSMDEIRKSGEKAQKQELNQAQAMAKLADSIERLVMSGGGQKGGFFDRFFHGFLGGLQASEEFRGIIIHIQQALRLTEQAGVRLGKAFVQLFPGVKMFLGGISDFFDPKKFGALFNGMTDELIKFFQGFTKGEYSFSKLMDNLKKLFFNFFDKSEGAGKKIIDGFKTFMSTLSKMVGEAIKWISDKIAGTITWIADVLSGKVKLDAPSAGGALGFLGEILTPIVEGLKHAWTVLAPAIWELLSVLADKALTFLKEKVLPKLAPFVPHLAAVLFGPALTRAALSALAVSLGKGLLSGAGSIIKGLSGKLAAASSTIKAAPPGPDVGALPRSTGIEQDAASAKAMTKGGNGISWSNVGMFLVGLAGVIAIGMVAIFGSIAIIRKYNISGEEIMKSLAIMGTVALATLPVAAALALMSKVQLDPVSAGIGILAIGVSILAMVGALALVYAAIKDLPLEKLVTITKILWEMSKVFIAASLVVLGATAIGAFIVGTSGIGGAIIAAGLGALASAVGVMTLSVVDIMKKLNDVPMGAGFKEKVDAFVKIMDAITNFSKNISAILEAVKPSFISLISGKDDTVERITKVKEMIDAMIGKPGGGGIIGMIEKIIWAIQQMSGGDGKMLEGAKLFADILSAMAGLAGSMKPPDAMFKAVDSMWSSAADVNKAITLTTQYADTVAKNVENLIKVFIEKVMPVVQGGGKGLSDQQIKGAAAIGQLLGSVVQIAQGMQPSQSTLMAMRDVSKNVVASGEDSSLKSENMKALGSYVDDVSKGLTKVLPAVIGAINPLLKSLGSWHFSETDTKALGAIGPLMQGMFGMVQTIIAQTAQMGANAGALDNKSELTTSFIKTMGKAIPQIFTEINKSLPEMFVGLKAGIIELSKGVNPEALKTGLATFKSLMDVVGVIPGIIASMGGGAVDGKAVSISGKGHSMAEVIEEVAMFFKEVFVGSLARTKSGDPPLKVISKMLNEGVIKDLAGQKGSIDSLKNLFSLISDITKIIKDLSNSATAGETSNAVNLSKGIEQISSFFSSITTKNGPLQMISNSLTDGSIQKLSTQKGSIETLKNVIQSVSSILKTGSDMSATAGTGSAAVIMGMMAISTMVGQANSLNEALGKLPDLKLNAKLKTLATGMGIGGKFNYEIKSQAVNIHVQFNVEMNAADLEKSLVLRDKSILRGRINYATGPNSGKEATDSLPSSTSSPFELNPKVK